MELLQVLPDVVEGVAALRRDDSLELKLLRTLLLHRHELNDVQIGIGQVVLTVNVVSTWSLFPTFLGVRGASCHILGVSLLVELFLGLLDLLLDVGGLLPAGCVVRAVRCSASAFLLGLLQFMGLHTLYPLEYVQEFLLLGIKETRWIGFITLCILVVHDTFSPFLVTLQQIQALIRHLMINTVDLASP